MTDTQQAGTQNFRDRILFGILSGWGSQAVSLALGIFTMPLFFRYLPKEQLGVWMFILGTGYFVSLADLGFSPVLGRQLAFELGKGDREGSPNHSGAAYYFNLSRYVAFLTAPVLLIGMLLIGGGFLWSLQLPEKLLSQSLTAWLLFALSQMVTCQFKYLETALNSHGETGWQNIIQTAMQMVTLVGYFVVLHFLQGDIVGLSAVVLGRTLLASLLAWWCVHKRIDVLFRARTTVGFGDVRPHLRPALDMFLVSLGGFLVLNTDQYFIVKFVGTEQLPDYAAAYRLVQVFYVFANTASSMCIPFISRKSSAGDRSGVHRMLMLNATAGMIIQLAAVSIIAVFGDHILELWLGKGHFVGWGVLWIFCIMLSLENHHVIFTRFGMNAHTAPIWGKMSLVSGLLNLVLTFIGVQLLGLLGVALGTMLAQMLTNNWYAVAKTLQVVQLKFQSYVRGSGIVWLSSCLLLLPCMFCVRSLIHLPLVSVLTGAATALLMNSVILYLYLRNRQVLGT